MNSNLSRVYFICSVQEETVDLPFRAIKGKISQLKGHVPLIGCRPSQPHSPGWLEAMPHTGQACLWAWHLLTPAPEMPFLQMSTWLIPPPALRLCLNSSWPVILPVHRFGETFPLRGRCSKHSMLVKPQQPWPIRAVAFPGHPTSSSCRMSPLGSPTARTHVRAHILSLSPFLQFSPEHFDPRLIYY